MLGTELKAIRVSLGLTQAQLAEQLEISTNSISRYEMASNQGRFPVPKWLARELNRLVTKRT